MSFVPKKRYTVEEYLALEEKAEYRSEYYQGEIFAMVGTTRTHNRIAINLIRELENRLPRQGPCEVLAMDVQLLVESVELYTYPDVMVACPPKFEGRAVTNPTVVFEVLSKSTASYDRGEKLEFYLELESLQEYILVSQSKPHVERYIRQPDGIWQYFNVSDLGASFEVASIQTTLVLADVYRGIDFSVVDTESERPELRVRPEE